MSIWRPIRADLRRILLTVPSIPAQHLELMSQPKPTVGVAYLEEAIEKGPAVPDTAGSYGMTMETGIYRIDLKWPTDKVKAEGEDMADAIRGAFWVGREIRAAGPAFISGGVTEASVRRTVPGDNWLTFPVRIEFYFRHRTRFGAFA